MFEDSIISTTSTTTFSKVRGFTVTLLYTLEGKGLRTCEVAELTGKTGAYVSSYLHRLWKYGLAEKEGFFWKLTSKGVSLLKYFREYEKSREEEKKKIYNIIYKSKQITTDNNRNITDDNRSITVERPKKTLQTSFEIWLKNYHRSLDDAEKVVVEVLLDHYNKTGSKYLLFNLPSLVYDFADKFKIHPSQVKQVMMNLKQDRIVYDYKLKSHNALKVGLYTEFLKKLEFIRKRGLD